MDRAVRISPAGVLTHANHDPRYASIAQKEVLSYLFRQGYPVTLYYLDSVRAEELAAHPPACPAARWPASPLLLQAP